LNVVEVDGAHNMLTVLLNSETRMFITKKPCANTAHLKHLITISITDWEEFKHERF